VVVVVGGLVVARLVRTRQPEHPAAATAAADVFFVRYAGTGAAGTLVPVRRTVPAGTADAEVAAALRALLDGPSASERGEGLVSEVPRGTELRSVDIRGGVATVDLTGPFAGGGGSASVLARVWQVVYTATQSPAASAVQIMIDGRRVPALGGEGFMVDSPLRRPASPPTF
jgi:spore germination protein GerM